MTQQTFEVGVITAVRHAELADVPLPEPGPGEALVQISSAAVCTWEQRTYSGQQENRLPFVGGHETAGTLAALGPGYRGPLAIGARVAVGASSCGSCAECYRGRDQLCPQHYGGAVRYGEMWGPGGFAQYKLHPSDGLYDIGDAPMDEACLAEPLSCALHAARMSGAGLLSSVVVIGAGVMGLMNVVAMKLHGARVIVSEMDAGRLAKAHTLGADLLVDASTTDPVEAVREATGGAGADVVVTAIGSGRANEQAMAMLARRGSLVLFASAHPQTPLTLQPNEIHNGEQRVIGSVSADKQDFYAASQLVRHRMVDLRPLLQAAYPLERLHEALEESLDPAAYRIVLHPQDHGASNGDPSGRVGLVGAAPRAAS